MNLVRRGDKWAFRTAADLSFLLLRETTDNKPLSRAALETLSIIAYRQPVARTELEGIRGVNVDGVLKTLVERDLVRIAGRGEGLGRPLLYATTERFLEYFGLPDLDALPRPEEVELAPPGEPRQEELFDREPGAGGPEP